MPQRDLADGLVRLQPDEVVTVRAVRGSAGDMKALAPRVARRWNGAGRHGETGMTGAPDCLVEASTQVQGCEDDSAPADQDLVIAVGAGRRGAFVTTKSGRAEMSATDGGKSNSSAQQRSRPVGRFGAAKKDFVDANAPEQFVVWETFESGL